MTRIARLSVLTTLLAAAACGGETPPPDDPDAGVDPDPDATVEPDAEEASTGTIAFTWNLLDNGAAATCPANGPDATLVSQPVGGGAYQDIYDCADGAGTAMDLPAGDYTVWIELGNGTTVAAMSEAVAVTVTGGETVDTIFAIDVANGFFDVSWTIAGSSCAAVANDGVSILSTLSGTVTSIDDIFNCTDGEAPAVATTAGIPIGDYVVVASLLDASQNAIGQAAEVQPSVEYGNHYVDLGTLTINLF